MTRSVLRPSSMLDARYLGLSVPRPSLHQRRQPDALTVHGRVLWLSRALGQRFARPNLFDVAQNVEHASGANVAERFGASLQSLLRSKDFRQLVGKSCLPPCSKTSAASNEPAASRLHVCPFLYLCKIVREDGKKVHLLAQPTSYHHWHLPTLTTIWPARPERHKKRPRGLGANSSPMLLRSDHVGARRFMGFGPKKNK